jgi:signal transduction histidine kinase/ligand-binding sensor domain-containing protein
MLVIFLAFPACLIAQSFNPDPDWRFENFNNLNHFSNKLVQNVAIDKSGYVWTSGEGIQRFDGFKTVDYNAINPNNAGLRNNYTDVLADDNGRIWISGGGLAYYDDAKARFIYLQLPGMPPINYAYAWALQKNELWFVCNLGLARVNVNTLQITLTSLRDITDPISGYLIDDNTFLISSREKNYLYTIDKDSYTSNRWVYDHILIKMFSMQKRGNDIYLGSSRGFFKLNPLSGLQLLDSATKGVAINDIEFLPQDTERKYLFIATDGKGLKVFNTATRKIEFTYLHDENNPYSLSSNVVTGLFIDRKKKLWIATGLGLCMVDFDNQQWKLRSIDKSISDDKSVFKIVNDKFDTTRFWLSSFNMGIICVDRQTKKIKKNYNTGNKLTHIIDFVQVNKTNWLLANHDDIMEWNPQTGIRMPISKFPLPDSLLLGRSVRKIVMLDAETAFITTNRGIFKYSLPTHKLTDAIKNSREIYNEINMGVGDCLPDGNTLWVTSDKGLLKYNIKTGYAKLFYNQKKPKYYLHRPISIDSNTLVCSSNVGLIFINKNTATLRIVNTLAGFHGMNVTSMIKVANKLWLGTETGIVTYDLLTGRSEKVQYETPVMETFTRSPFEMVGNDLAVGFRAGYAYFKPVLNNSSIPSDAVIDGVTVNNKQILERDASKLVFGHNNNSVNIGFTAFLYTYPDNINFRYRLKGADAKWQYTKDVRSANYAQLSPGQYVFYVQSGNNIGVWNKNVASLAFTIKPPYWATWWFRTLLLLLLAFVLYQLYKYKIQHIRDIEAIRQGIATDFHDDLGSTLSSISIFSQVAIAKSETDLPATKKMVDDIGTRARDMIQSMNDMVWAIKPENDTLYRLMQRMEEFGYPVAEAKETQLLFKMDESLYAIKTDMVKRKNLFLIFKEVFNNAIKYSNAKQIEVKFKLQNKHTLLMQITDNGIGFDTGSQKQGNGLNNIKKRACEIKANLAIKTSPGCGTAINIICKIT